MKYYFTLLFIALSSSLYASPQDNLNNWLDSTFIAHEIEWEKAEEEFILYTENHYKKAKNLSSFLDQFKTKKRKETSKKFSLDNPDNYPHFEHLGQQATPILKELEVFMVRLILAHQLENDPNDFTRFLIQINHLNHVPLNHLTTIKMKHKLLGLNAFFKLTPEIIEKFSIMLFAKKLFLENDYIPKDELIASISDWQNKDSLQNVATHAIQEKDPSFIGGPVIMMEYVQLNFNYPELAREMGEQGIVHVTFIVDSKGQIKNVGIRKGVSDSIDKEAMRIIKMMPLWTPGILKGELVNVNFTLPIRYRLG